jgi:hypothetical protein
MMPQPSDKPLPCLPMLLRPPDTELDSHPRRADFMPATDTLIPTSQRPTCATACSIGVALSLCALPSTWRRW